MEKPKDIFSFLEEARKAGVPDEQIYSKVSFFLEEKARNTATPYHGSFELTPLCNLNCKMCYVHLDETQMQGRNLLSAETWIDLMGQAIEAGMARAVLTGGECLTYPQFDELYLFLKSKGTAVTVKTNGVLLNSERIIFFERYPPRSILVTLYGDSDETYEKVTGYRAFTNVLKNIQQAKEAKLPISIMITPNRYMGEAVKETIRFVKNLDIPYFINSTLISPRPDTQREKKNYDLTLDEYVDIFLHEAALNNNFPTKQATLPLERGDESQYELSGIKCGAGKSGFAIRWDGSMHPCLSMHSISDNPLEVGFISAWQYINREVNRFPAFKKCERCAYSQECSYCAAENEQLGSRFFLNYSWCQRTWKLVENGLAFFERQCE